MNREKKGHSGLQQQQDVDRWAWLSGFDARKCQQPILYLALVDQLKYAIEQGWLRAGDRLVTHRELSRHLQIAVATVSKVYRHAPQQGLIPARVGRGSFVSSYPVLGRVIRAHDFQSINLSIIKPQLAIGEAFMAQQLKALAAQPQLADLMDYNTQCSDTDRRAAADWLSAQGVEFSGKSISICSGAQHGLMVLINSLSEYGDHIAVEHYCYPGIISLANQLGRKLIAIEMDEQGMIPQALDKACAKGLIKLLIVVASHQNPTTAVMSIARRKALAKIVKKYAIHLIDDDVYGFLSPQLPALANFAPEQSFYLTSLSKSVFPGLRVAYIVAPTQYKIRIEAQIRQSIWMPAPLTLALASRLILAGQAADIQRLQSELAIKRQRIAAKMLNGFNYLAQLNSYHLWLILPDDFSSESFCQALEQRGVLVSSSAYFNAQQQAPCAAVRISLMAPATENELVFGLKIVVALLVEGVTAV